MTGPRLSPPPNYTSWLDCAVDCMDTRSLEQDDSWLDDQSKHWPAGTTREQMVEAVREELAELRARASTDQCGMSEKSAGETPLGIPDIWKQLEKLDGQRAALANLVHGFLVSNYPQFIETMKCRRPEATLFDVVNWLLRNDAEGLKLIFSGNENVLLLRIFREDAGVY